MMLPSGKLDRRVQFLRAVVIDDGYQARPTAFQPHGSQVWGAFKPVSDGERFRAGSIGIDVTARFIVRHSSFAAGITTADRLVCEGRTYAIGGIKEIGRREGFEITASEIEP